MSVGLPGSGIGGVFYLLSALWMPFDGAARLVGKRARPSVHLIWPQALLALGIIGAIALTGWTLEHVIAALNTTTSIDASGVARSAARSPRIFEGAALALTFSTLAIVLLSVQVLRLFAAPKPSAPSLDEPEERIAA